MLFGRNCAFPIRLLESRSVCAFILLAEYGSSAQHMYVHECYVMYAFVQSLQWRVCSFWRENGKRWALASVAPSACS